MHHIYLSRRNLLTLLSKLDRARAGEATACAIVKQDKDHPKFKLTVAPIMVTAVEDDEYYIDRPPGNIVEADAERLEHLAVVREFMENVKHGDIEGVEAAMAERALKRLGVL
jgi:hypothetical protein